MDNFVNNKDSLIFEYKKNYTKFSIILIMFCLVVFALYLNEYLDHITTAPYLFGIFLAPVLIVLILLPIFNYHRETVINKDKSVVIKEKRFFKQKISRSEIDFVQLSTDITKANVNLGDAVNFVRSQKLRDNYQRFTFVLKIKTKDNQYVTLHQTSLPLNLFPASGIQENIPKTEDSKFNSIIGLIGLPLKVDLGGVHNPVPVNIVKQSRGTPIFRGLKLKYKDNNKIIIKIINQKRKGYTSVFARNLLMIILMMPAAFLMYNLKFFWLTIYGIFILIPGMTMSIFSGSKQESLLTIDKTKNLINIYDKKQEKLIEEIKIDNITSINVWQNRIMGGVDYRSGANNSDSLYHFYTFNIGNTEILFADARISKFSILNIPIIPISIHKTYEPDKVIYAVADFLNLPIVTKN